MVITAFESRANAGASVLIDELIRAWAAGDGQAFGRPFAEHAFFIGFDGSLLRGPHAIGRFHEQAFSTYLAGTRLQVEIETIRMLTRGITVVVTRGGIRPDADARGPLIYPSIQTSVIREVNSRYCIESFHSTRDRPLTGPREAQAWHDFDQAWSRLYG
jgi:uncharacterized protein (TIGR02246 family)